ncbi:MAG: 30S ribosomal protein S19 [Candidatus Thermoplasmatota archaeon]|nr:30S ribosomal protein S19 [Candidatus Thermoplasmatota archaeon]MDI6856016.1 30S ribosomal protein S19 [Candidatus Thermoplasmatota archaeon]
MAKKKVITRRKKIFTYRGYTLEQLKQMTKEELIKILPARARRSLKRGFSEEQQKFWDKVRKSDKVIETHRRDILVMPELVGKKIGVHYGKGFKVIEIIPEMIGHYLGEFTMTREFVKHSGPGVGATRSSKFLPLK